MARGQEREDDRQGPRPSGEHPPTMPRTTETPERSDQQSIPALERDRRKRKSDHRQRVSGEPGTARDLGSNRHQRPIASGRERAKEPLRTSSAA